MPQPPTPQRPVKSKVIAGHTYNVTLLGAKAGRTMSVRLLKMLGPASASFLEGALHAPGGVTESITLGAVDAIRELTTKLDSAELAAISDELAKFTTVTLDDDPSGQPREPRLDHIFDDHFAGRYDAMAQWLAFALEANFASFFAGSAASKQALLAQLRTLIASQSPSPTTSTGISTASPPADATALA